MKIPKLQPQVAGKTPDMSANYWALRQAGEGMNRVGRGLGDIGQAAVNVVENIVKEKRKISQATELGEARVNFENDYITNKKEWDQTSPDVDTYYQQGSALYDKTLEKSLRQIKDTKVRDSFKIMMLEHKVTVLDSLGKEANQKWLDKNIASKIAQVDTFTNLAGQTSDPEYAKSYKESARAVIRSMSGNLIHQTKALELEKAKMQELDEASIKNHILTDPVGAAKALEAGDYADLSPKDRPYYKAQAKTAIKMMENENEDKQVDLVVRGLKKEFGSDYTTIENRIDDFDYMNKKFGPTVNTRIIAKVREDMRSRQISDDKIATAKSKAVFKDTWLNLDKTSISEIKRRVREDGLDVGHGDALIKEKLNPPDIPSNPVEYNRVLDVIYDDTVSVKEKTNAVLAARIPRHEKDNLLGLAHRDEDKVGDQNIKNGLAIIKEQIGPKTDMFGKMLPFSEKESKNYYYANQQLQEAILEAKRNKKPLAPKEVIDKAFEISHSIKLTLGGKAKIRTNELAEQGKALVEGTKKIEPKKPGETIEEYMKRTRQSAGMP